jgi:hypothetical protein
MIPATPELLGAPHKRVLMHDVETNRVEPAKPTITDVLSALQSDCRTGDIPTFESYCDEFGEDTDSRASERTYKECVKIRGRLRLFLGQHYAAFESIEDNT